MISLWLLPFSFRNELFKNINYIFMTVFRQFVCFVICGCSGVAVQWPLSLGSEVRGYPVLGLQWTEERTLCCRPSWVWNESEQHVTLRSNQYMTWKLWVKNAVLWSGLMVTPSDADSPRPAPDPPVCTNNTKTPAPRRPRLLARRSALNQVWHNHCLIHIM